MGLRERTVVLLHRRRCGVDGHSGLVLAASTDYHVHALVKKSF
jgi:hypothetical protein